MYKTIQLIFLKNCKSLQKIENIANFGDVCKFCNFFKNQLDSFVDLEKPEKNAYLVAKFRFDTAENEPRKE